jgi:FOG: WD40 repeat
MLTETYSRIWDTQTGQCLRTLVHEDNPAVTNVCFSPNGRFVLAFNLDNSIRLWDYVQGTVKKTYQGHTNQGFSIGGCFGILTDVDNRNSPRNEEEQNGRSIRRQPFIASASEDGDIVMWDVNSKQVVQRIKGAHKGVCFWVDVNGGTMVSCGQDGAVKVWRHVPPRMKIKREENGVDGEGDVTMADGSVSGRVREEEV